MFKRGIYGLIFVELLLGLLHSWWPDTSWGQGREAYFNFANSLTLASWLLCAQFAGIGLLCLIQFHRPPSPDYPTHPATRFIWFFAACVFFLLSLIEMTRFPMQLSLVTLIHASPALDFLFDTLQFCSVGLFSWFLLKKVKPTHVETKPWVIAWLSFWTLYTLSSHAGSLITSMPGLQQALTLVTGLSLLLGCTCLLQVMGNVVLTKHEKTFAVIFPPRYYADAVSIGLILMVGSGVSWLWLQYIQAPVDNPRITMTAKEIQQQVPIFLVPDPTLLVINTNKQHAYQEQPETRVTVQIQPAVMRIQTTTLTSDHTHQPDSGVRITIKNAPGFTTKSDQQFDVITFMQPPGLLFDDQKKNTGLELLRSYDAIKHYLIQLTADGILNIKEPISHPRDEVTLWRTLVTLRQSLLDGGISQPDKHFFVLHWRNKGENALQIIMKKSPLSKEDIAKLTSWSADKNAEMIRDQTQLSSQTSPTQLTSILYSPDLFSENTYARLIRGQVVAPLLEKKAQLPLSLSPSLFDSLRDIPVRLLTDTNMTTLVIGFSILLFLVISSFLLFRRYWRYWLTTTTVIVFLILLSLPLSLQRSPGPADLVLAADQYHVYGLRYGQSVTRENKHHLGSNGPAIPIDWLFWVVQGHNRTVLINPGFDNKDLLQQWELVNFVHPLSRLKQLGIAPEEVDDIIITRGKWDHMGTIEHFPNATVWLQKEEYYHILTTMSANAAMTNDILFEDWQALLRVPESRLRLIDGDHVITPGIDVSLDAKASPGSQTVTVNTRLGNVLVASDLTLAYELKPMEPLLHIAASPFYLLPSHDPEIMVWFPEISEGIVEITANPQQGR